MDEAKRNKRRFSPKEPPDRKHTDKRSPGERDRDRVLYTSAFRRLAEVTQVIAANSGHVFHNRLTHSLQVAQVGRRLAQRLLALSGEVVRKCEGIDPDVVEAACLAHDLGHPPFGHIAETELNRLAGDEIGGFEGNAQSFRIVTHLAFRSPDYRGLNLTRATLAGILKYPWLKGGNPKKPDKWGAYSSEKELFDFACELLPKPGETTIEAALMDWADDITYAVHDMEDFYRAGRIPLHLLAAREGREREYFFASVFKRNADKPGWDKQDDLKEAFTEPLRGYFSIADPYDGKWLQRAYLRNFTGDLINRYIGGTELTGEKGRCKLKVNPGLRLEIDMLKQLTWTYVIEAPSLATQQYGQIQVIRRLFWTFFRSALRSAYEIFPPYYREQLETSSTPDDKRRLVIDLIAGMTESQALEMCNRLSGVTAGSPLEDIMA